MAVDVECSAERLTGAKHGGIESKDDYALEKDLLKVLDDALALPWGGGGT